MDKPQVIKQFESAVLPDKGNSGIQIWEDSNFIVMKQDDDVIQLTAVQVIELRRVLYNSVEE